MNEYWQVVATIDEISEGKSKVVEYDEEEVCLFRIGDHVYAIADHCAHQGAPLSSQGVLNEKKKEVACSWHGWRFDLETGKSTNVPGFKTKVYQVKIEGGAISIQGSKKNEVRSSEPEVGSDADRALLDSIYKIVESDIRPAIQMDGGDIEVMGVVQGIVKVKLHGACTTCSSSSVTLYQGVSNILSNKVPGVIGVEQVF